MVFFAFHNLLEIFIPATLTFFSEIVWFISVLLRITDLGLKNYQRNADGDVGFRLIPLSGFGLQGSRGSKGVSKK
jgi:hypothetical protein